MKRKKVIIERREVEKVKKAKRKMLKGRKMLMATIAISVELKP
jgi:hypothetical protein